MARVEWWLCEYITTLNSVENKQAVTPPIGPKPGGTSPVAPISKARAAVLARLREINGTLTVDQLAAESGQHANTAREHLEALVAGGQATKTAAPKEGRGRPAWMYQAVADPAGPVGYAALAASLAQHIAAHSENPAAEGEAAGRAWARALPPAHYASARSATSGQGVRNHVVQALEQAGFGVERNKAATALTLTTCPIVEAARNNPEVVCAVHLGLVKEVMKGGGLPEREAELLPFAGPGFCTLRLPADPRRGAAEPSNEASDPGSQPAMHAAKPEAASPSIGTP